MTKELSGVVEIPVLALRDVVVYPQMVIPLFVGREKSIRCLDIANENDKQIFLVAQKDAAVDDPTQDDLIKQVPSPLFCKCLNYLTVPLKY